MLDTGADRPGRSVRSGGCGPHRPCRRASGIPRPRPRSRRARGRGLVRLRRRTSVTSARRHLNDAQFAQSVLMPRFSTLRTLCANSASVTVESCGRPSRQLVPIIRSPAMGGVLACRMIDLLTPPVAVERPADPTDRDTARYVRSYLIMRVLVGALGIALPFVLVLSDGLVFDGDPFPRDSLSTYYYSGARAVRRHAQRHGDFLHHLQGRRPQPRQHVEHRRGDRRAPGCRVPDGEARRCAGVDAAAGLARRVGRAVHPLHRGRRVHRVAGGDLLLLRNPRRQSAAPRRQAVAGVLAAFPLDVCRVIAAAIVFIVVTGIAGGPDKSLLIGEAVSVWAFGVSWLAKGLELDLLRDRDADGAARRRSGCLRRPSDFALATARARLSPRTRREPWTSKASPASP